MSIGRNAVRSGLWLASFRFITQAISWSVTVIIARILSPEDYGLMSLASILTGYVEVFSQMGLGSAIIQRETNSQKELSSNFWFSLGIGFGFSLICLGLARPTAWITNEPRVIPITEVISILFVIGALMVVPYNILVRELKFKVIGMIQLIGVAISSVSMLWMARNGFGVWTLINGTLILRTITVGLVFFSSKWRPSVWFHFKEVRPYLRFGINIAGASSLFYMFQKLDRLIIGKMLGVQSLGYYSLAMELASIPTDKIISIVNQVSFPVFSRFQNDRSKSNEIYLKTLKFIALFVSPLYLGGAFFGDDIIRAILGEKWIPIVFLFRIFCLTQFLVAITNINGIIHNSAGRSYWVFYFQGVNAFFMPLAIYFAAPYGVHALAIPWLVAYPIICMGWTRLTLRKIKISVKEYMMNLAIPVLASIAMVGGSQGIRTLLVNQTFFKLDHTIILIEEVLVGASFYFTCLLLFEKKNLVEFWKLLFQKESVAKVIA